MKGKKPKRRAQPGRMSSRELREKMSHDPLVDSITWMRKTWSEHGSKMTWGLAAILVAYFGVRFYMNQQRSQVDQATMLFDVAYEDFMQSWGKQGEEKAKLQETIISSVDGLVAGFSGTQVAVHGLLLKADILYRQGTYEEALEAYQMAQAKAEEEDLVVMSRIGAAQCRASLESATAGIGELEAVLQQFPETNFGDQIHFQLARLFESVGDDEQAVEHYSAIHEDSPLLDDQTKRHIEFLKAPVFRFSEPSA